MTLSPESLRATLGTGLLYTPAFIQTGLCGPPTGGRTEYLTGPLTWSCSSAPLWAEPSPGHPVVSHASTPGIPEVLATRVAGAWMVVSPEDAAGMICPLF